MADINVGTMTLAQMVGRIIEKQDTLAGGEWILSMIETLTAERDEARSLLRDAVAQTLAGDALGVELSRALAEIERLRPAAEAWLYKQACEAWDAGKITPFEFAEAYKLYSPQARRAREARS